MCSQVFYVEQEQRCKSYFGELLFICTNSIFWGINNRWSSICETLKIHENKMVFCAGVLKCM